MGDGRDEEEKKRRGDGDGDGDSRAWPAASSEPRRKTIGLTPDAIMEVSHLRVASLLRRSGRASGGVEIAATPSLVSLSGDFFIRDDRRGRRWPRSLGREAYDEGGGGDGIRGRTNDDDVAMSIRDTTTTTTYLEGASFDGSQTR